MEYDMTLQWRAGTQHQLPDALSRLFGNTPEGTDVDDAFPDDSTLKSDRRTKGPQGPTLDGIPLSQLGEERREPADPAAITALRSVADTALNTNNHSDKVAYVEPEEAPDLSTHDTAILLTEIPFAQEKVVALSDVVSEVHADLAERAPALLDSKTS